MRQQIVLASLSYILLSEARIKVNPNGQIRVYQITTQDHPKHPSNSIATPENTKNFQFQIRKHNTEVSGQWVTVCPVDTSRNSVYRKQGYPPPHVCSALGLTRTPIYGWADHEGRTHFSPKHDTLSRASLPQSQKHNTVCLVKTDLIDPKAHFSPQREGELFLHAWI